MEFTRKKLNGKLDIQVIKEAGISLYSEDEIYVKIKGFNDYYISNYGHVISTKRGKITLLTPNREDEDLIHKKYYCIGIYNNKGEPKNPKIHTLVARAFCVKPKLGEKMEVHHINTYSYEQENEECNRADNLAFVTKKFHSVLDSIEKIGVVRNNTSESFTYYKNPYIVFKEIGMKDYQFYDFIISTENYLQRENSTFYCTFDNKYHIEIVSKNFRRIIGDIRKSDINSIKYVCDNIPIFINNKAYIVPYTRPI